MDPWRFTDRLTRRIMEAWIARELPRPIPWTPLAKPLAECRIGLVSSAGLSMRDDVPFDEQGERDDPWWGDPTHRLVPREATAADVRVSHLHIDRRPAQADLDCVLPLRRLDELVRDGVVGGSADVHVSIMGYLLRPERLVHDTVPRIAAHFLEQGVDLVALAPA